MWSRHFLRPGIVASGGADIPVRPPASLHRVAPTTTVEEPLGAALTPTTTVEERPLGAA